MSAKIKTFDDECVRVDKATVISNKKMFEVIGQSRYYSRNEDSIHETILESGFIDSIFLNSCKRIKSITILLSEKL